jgi:hypothetical protein
MSVTLAPKAAAAACSSPFDTLENLRAARAARDGIQAAQGLRLPHPRMPGCVLPGPWGRWREQPLAEQILRPAPAVDRAEARARLLSWRRDWHMSVRHIRALKAATHGRFLGGAPSARLQAELAAWRWFAAALHARRAFL